MQPKSLMRRTAGILCIAIVSCLGQARATSEAEFFDSKGTAVAYFDYDDADRTFYLWSEGEPVAHMDEDSLYGFNGKHLGWLQNGVITNTRVTLWRRRWRDLKTQSSRRPPRGPNNTNPTRTIRSTGHTNLPLAPLGQR